MRYATTVRLTLADDAQHPLPGLTVRLFDRDLVTRDDALGEAVTDAAGEARFEFAAADFVDVDDRVGGTRPELFAVVTTAAGEEVANTRADSSDNFAPKYIHIRIARNLAERHNLLAPPSIST
jgi:hypothetical protein